MQIHTFKNASELSSATAEWIVSLIEKKLTTSDRFCLLLSGGNTPKQLYQLLASTQYRNKIHWKKLHIFFGDERVVPFEDDLNNGKMAFDALLSSVPIPKKQIHYIDTSIDPAHSAKNYSDLLHQYFEETVNSFDLALLGMGDDGHTLSLFPGSFTENDLIQWVVSIYLSSQQMHRISLTPEIVNKSSRIAFMVTGAAKAPILKEILNNTGAPHSYPAQLINPSNGELHWFLDDAAAHS